MLVLFGRIRTMSICAKEHTGKVCQNIKITEYLSKIGKKGGYVKSAVKAKSSRENGKKGGRPKDSGTGTEGKR